MLEQLWIQQKLDQSPMMEGMISAYTYVYHTNYSDRCVMFLLVMCSHFAHSAKHTNRNSSGDNLTQGLFRQFQANIESCRQLINVWVPHKTCLVLAKTCPAQWMTLHNIEVNFFLGKCGLLIVHTLSNHVHFTSNHQGCGNWKTKCNDYVMVTGFQIQ